MDWFILIFLVPLILVPIVLLCGFAGCGLNLAGELVSPPPDPSNLEAKAGGTRLVKLSWKDNAGGKAKFQILRAEEGSTPPPIGKETGEGATSFDNKFEDLSEGTETEGRTFVYRVRATWGPFPSFIPSAPSSPCATTTLPKAPTDLKATPEDVDKITLTWTNVSSKATKFRVQHRPFGGGFFNPIPMDDDKIPKCSHSPLLPGIHEYEVFAIVEDGRDNNVNKNVESAPSGLIVPSPVWKTAFAAALGGNQDNWANDCMVQRINAAALLASGNPVKITLRSSGNAGLNIKRAYISQAAHPEGSAVDLLVDSDGDDLTLMRFSIDPAIAEGVALLAGGSVTSDPTPYNLVHTKDLMLAFDIGAQGGARRGPKPGCQAYRGVDTEQAATANRSNFTVQGPPANPAQGQPANTVYLVEKIEVLVMEPLTI